MVKKYESQIRGKVEEFASINIFYRLKNTKKRCFKITPNFKTKINIIVLKNCAITLTMTNAKQHIILNGVFRKKTIHYYDRISRI